MKSESIAELSKALAKAQGQREIFCVPNNMSSEDANFWLAPTVDPYWEQWPDSESVPRDVNLYINKIPKYKKAAQGQI